LEKQKHAPANFPVHIQRRLGRSKINTDLVIVYYAVGVQVVSDSRDDRCGVWKESTDAETIRAKAFVEGA